MNKNSFCCFVLFGFFSLFHSQIMAQGVCPITTLKIGELKGKVVTSGRAEDEPLAQTKVELRRLDENETLVSSAVTDEKGTFEISEIKSGKYRLVVWFILNNQLYFKYYVKLEIKDKLKKAKRKSSILIKLGIDCQSSEASLVSSS